jgi:hypothetical protein
MGDAVLDWTTEKLEKLLMRRVMTFDGRWK